MPLLCARAPLSKPDHAPAHSVSVFSRLRFLPSLYLLLPGGTNSSNDIFNMVSNFLTPFCIWVLVC